MGRRKKGDKVDGWINLDKPLELGSTQAVGKIRRIYNAQKVGHAGTLDPLATGVLPIALGEATKTIPYIQDALKTYEFTVTWGEQRSTDDAQGEVIASSEVRPRAEAIQAALPDYIGNIQQIPPQFSAIKIDGQRAYDLARAGETVEIKSRQVYIESLELLEARTDEADFRMVCGKGTYVRSLARDIALQLGGFGYISALRRTAVGCFRQENAISLANLQELSDKGDLDQALQPIDSALDDILALPISDKEAALIKNGQALSFISHADFHRLDGMEAEVLAVANDKPVAIVEIEGPKVKPIRVFNI